jgi:D-3-phosphoglycerate dehydrogenase
MAQLLVAVSDSVFPNLDQARAVLAKVNAEVRLAADSRPETILGVARDADALLTTYAKITGDMIRQMKRCRIIRGSGSAWTTWILPSPPRANRRYQGAGLLPGRSVRPRHGLVAGRRAQEITLANKQVHAGAGRCRLSCPFTACGEAFWVWWGLAASPARGAKGQAFGMRRVASDPFIPKAVFDRPAWKGGFREL